MQPQQQQFPKQPKKGRSIGVQRKFLTNYYDIQLYANVKPLHQYSIVVEPQLPENMTLTYKKLIQSRRHDVDRYIGFKFARGKSIFGTKKKNTYEFNTFLWKNTQKVEKVKQMQQNSQGEKDIWKVLYSRFLEEQNDKMEKAENEQKNEKDIKKEQLHYIVTIKYVKEIDLRWRLNHSKDPKQIGQAIQVINSYTKTKLQELGLKQLGKGKFYYRTQLQNLEKAKRKQPYQYCRGYKFTLCPLNSGIYMQIDTISRVLRNPNFLEDIQRKCGGNNYSNIYDSKRFQGLVVMARYGNFKTYTVQKIDNSKNPNTLFIPHGSRQLITYKQYAQNNYNVHVTNTKQPLVVAVDTIKIQMKKGGKQKEKKVDYIFLIPQLLCLTGILQEDRRNGEIMKQISNNTKFNPFNRLKLIQQAKCDLNKKVDIISIKQKKKQMYGLQLYPPTIVGHERLTSKDGSISLHKIRFQQKLDSDPCTWINFYPQKDNNSAFVDRFSNQLINLIGDKYNINLEYPINVGIKGKQFYQFPKQLIEDIKNKIQQKKPDFVIFFIHPDYHKQFYPTIKCLCNQMCVPSQFITTSKLFQFFPEKCSRKNNNSPSFLLNIFVQIFTKIGKIPWSVQSRKSQYFKNKNIAIGSLAISKVNNVYTLAFVGTTNGNLNHFFCQTRNSRSLNQLKTKVTNIFSNWIRQFFYANGGKGFSSTPDHFIIYRQGLSKSEISKNIQFQFLCLEQAIQNARDKIKKKAKISDEIANKYKPKIVWFTVNKKTSSRFYLKQNNKKVNPLPGSVIIDEMSMLGFTDFHLTPHHVDQSTTSCPTHFVLAQHNISKSDWKNGRFPLEELIQLSYEQCYNYFNWKGAIRFPASLQYADKLAKMASKYYRKEIGFDDVTRNKLYFL